MTNGSELIWTCDSTRSEWEVVLHYKARCLSPTISPYCSIETHAVGFGQFWWIPHRPLMFIVFMLSGIWVLFPNHELIKCLSDGCLGTDWMKWCHMWHACCHEGMALLAQDLSTQWTLPLMSHVNNLWIGLSICLISTCIWWYNGIIVLTSNLSLGWFNNLTNIENRCAR